MPHSAWQTTTFIAALRCDRIDSPYLIEASANMEVFQAYVGHVLCPGLHPGDVVILDDLCIHKTPAIAMLVAARGATIRCLPPYSPDLNPIEMAFAKFKSHLRSSATRSLETLHSAIVDALGQFRADYCSGLFRHARYTTKELEKTLGRVSWTEATKDYALPRESSSGAYIKTRASSGDADNAGY